MGQERRIALPDFRSFTGWLAAARLAKQFGVTMYLPYARNHRFHEGWDNERLDFSRANSLLADNAITNGRATSERVSHVVTFTGQSLSGSAEHSSPSAAKRRGLRLGIAEGQVSSRRTSPGPRVER